MTHTAKPTVLMVHGAWHTPEHYAKLETALSDAGFQVVIPHLPTCSKVLPPPYAFADDCGLIKHKAVELAEQGKYFIVLMHSYGGVVGTNSLKDLAATQRTKQGLSGGAVRLIYMCAFLLPLHGYLSQPFGGKLPPHLAIQEEQGTNTMIDPEYRFYEEVEDQAERAHWIGLLTWHPLSASMEGGTVNYAAYRDIPTTYFVCENDRALPMDAQLGLIKAAEGPVVKIGNGEGALETGGVFGGKVDIVTSQAGHSPFLSRPEEVVSCVERAFNMWQETLA